ncbi:MAG: hypothetical protein R3F34_00890 [Planctomycetota bacterium]
MAKSTVFMLYGRSNPNDSEFDLRKANEKWSSVREFEVLAYAQDGDLLYLVGQKAVELDGRPTKSYCALRVDLDLERNASPAQSWYEGA